MTRATLGAFGEAWARGYLTRLGYRIVEQNVRFRSGEIDIVAWHGATLVFVEVKCRRSTWYGSPEASISRSRYARLAAACETYMQDRGIEPDSLRIDVLALQVDRIGRVVRHELIENAEPPD